VEEIDTAERERVEEVPPEGEDGGTSPLID